MNKAQEVLALLEEEGKIIPIETSKGKWDVVIMDTTHIKYKTTGREESWSVLHFAQVYPEMMDQLVKAGVVNDRAFKESIGEERKFDLGAGHLGNGVSVWNRAKEVSGDYEKIAHIDSNRKVTWYITDATPEVKKYVNDIATGPNEPISTSQPDQKVFNK